MPAVRVGIALMCCLNAAVASAQGADLLDDDDAVDEGESDERSLYQDAVRDVQRERPGRDVEEIDEDWEPRSLPIGADLGVEIGVHGLVSFFTAPRLPALDPGFGVQGRAAMTAYKRLVAEASAGLMVNGEEGGNASYKMLQVRAGARYPIDLGAYPVLFFVGAGVGVGMSWVTTIDPSTAISRTRTGLAPTFDVLFGLVYEVTDRLGLEAIVQGSYATATEVYFNKAASWFSILAGVSYDL